MSNARNLADLLNASGKIKSSKLDAASVANDSLDSQHYAAASIDLEHLSSQAVDEDNLYVSNAGTDGQYLQKQSGNAGGLTWGTVDLTTLSGANLTSGIIPTARINAGSIANDLITTQHIADSVALGGSPTTTTQSAADNSTKVATTAYADAAIAALADSAPSTLNTLNELAAALGDDENYSTTITTALGTKLPKAGGTMTGDVSLGDNVKAKFGAGDDLQIYHDGSNSVIKDSGTGNLKVLVEDLRINNSSDTAAILSGNRGGAVTAYYNGAAKLATTSTGVDVTGILYVNGDATGGRITGDGSGGLDLQDGNGRQTFKIMSPASGSSQSMTLAASGNLGIGTVSPTSPLHITGSGHTALTITGGASSDAQIRFGDSANTTIGMINYDNAINALKFVVNGSSAAIIDSSGNVGIGTASPSSKLTSESAASTNIVAKSTNGNGGYYNYQGLASDGTQTFGVNHNGTIFTTSGLAVGGTGAANTLDDYEEGTWTPAFGRNGGTQPSVVYNEQVGSYTKVGNMVFLTGDMGVNSISIPQNGTLTITGMPFTKGSAHNPTGSFTSSQFNLYRARGQLVHVDETKLGFLGQAASTGQGGWDWEPVSALDGNESLRFAITYQV